MTISIGGGGIQHQIPYYGLFKISSHVKKELLIFIPVFIAYSITAAANMGFAFIIEKLDVAFTDDASIWKIYAPLALLGLIFIRSFGNAFGNLASAYIANQIAHKLTVIMYRHLIRLPLSFFNKSSVGEIMSKITYNIGCISQALQGGVIVLLRETITVIVLMGYLFYLNWSLTLIVAAVFPIIGILLDIARRRLKVLGERLQKGAALISGSMSEVLNSLPLVRVFIAEEHEIKKFKQFSSYRKRESMKAALVTSITMPFLQIILAIPFAVIIWIGISGDNASFDSTGELMGYITAILLISTPLRLLTGVQGSLQNGEVAALDYQNHLSLDYEKDQGTIIIAKDKLKGGIKLHNVTFSYEPEKPVLSNLNLTIEAAKKTALVGLSGSGKSTIVNLILGLYCLEKGAIYLDGVNINDIKLTSLRSNIGYVSQDIFLFNNTLRYNLVYGKNEDISDENIKQILQKAHAWAFVEDMPQGLDTKLGERGIMLSGGQQQRISLARVLLKDTKILIMDEATSALDVETEYHIRRNLKEIMRGRTVLVIAHRLSTVEKMDKVIVLKKGQVIEEGTHIELLNKRGHYSELCSYQFKD